MKRVEIEIIPVSGDRVSVSVVYDVPGSAPMIRRRQVERPVLDGICEAVDEAVRRATAGPAHAAGTGEEPEAEPSGDLAAAGRALFEALFRDQCDRLRSEIRRGDIYFIFKVDRSLAYLPFEILHDGEKFISLHFALGRVVYSEAGRGAADAEAGGDRVLILGDPSDDPVIRDDVEREVDSLRDLFRKDGRYGITIAMGPEVGEGMILSLLPETALLHFTGHGATGPDGSPGLELHGGGVLSAGLFEGVGRPPVAAFFNTCSTASHAAWRSPLGIMEALISRGTRACIAPLWDVASRAATSAALAFYERLLEGDTFGEALRGARVALSKGGESGDPTWAAYALYGDPLAGLATVAPARRGRRRARAGLRIGVAVLAALALILAPREAGRRMTGTTSRAEVGYVIVESEPADARILLDGEEAGLTPAALEIDVGEHQVTLVKKGYRRWQATVDVKKGPTAVVRAVLQEIEE